MMRLGKAKSEKLCFSICICPRLSLYLYLNVRIDIYCAETPCVYCIVGLWCCAVYVDMSYFTFVS